ncbi:MAG: SDR family oxidoreductase [Gammaproteobacteria bacterium]
MAEKARTVLVTGASRGIGQAISLLLLGQGHNVIGLARDFSRFGAYPRFHPGTIDLADLDALPARLGALAKDWPRVDALVLNAGQGRFGSLEEFSYGQIRALVDLNFTAQAFVTRAFLPLMKRHPPGDVLFIGSEAALWGGRRGAVYSASKAALRGFAQALRDECGRAGIRVSVINPGMVRTEFFAELPFAPGDDAANAILAEEVAATVGHVLASRPELVFDEINLSPLKKVLRFKGD